MWQFLPSLITNTLGIFSDWVKAKREVKAATVDAKIALNKAKTDAMIERMRTQQAADIAWENLSVENSGWKDEWFTLLLSIPMIMCFIPGGAQYVKAGFEALSESTPEWYQYAFLVAVASAFGFKKLTDLMQLRKGV